MQELWLTTTVSVTALLRVAWTGSLVRGSPRNLAPYINEYWPAYFAHHQHVIGNQQTTFDTLFSTGASFSWHRNHWFHLWVGFRLGYLVPIPQIFGSIECLGGARHCSATLWKRGVFLIPSHMLRLE